MKIGARLVFSLFLLVFIIGVVGATIENVYTEPEYPTTSSTLVNVYATITADPPATSIKYATLYYDINNGQVENNTNFSGPFINYAVISYPNPQNGDKVNYYIKAVDNLNNIAFSSVKTFYYDSSPPSVTVTGAPSGYIVNPVGISAGVNCSDPYSSCDFSSYRLKFYTDNNGGICSNNYAEYTSINPVTGDKWVCAAAKDNAGNIGYSSSPVEFTVFDTIQSAIDRAPAGTTINVAAGIYNENVNVNKPLTLQGVSSATVTVSALNPATSVFTVTANSVNISGFTISGATGGGQAGIYIGNSVTGSNIFNNILTGSFDGIWLGLGSNHNTFTSNTLSNNYQGFEVYHSDYNTFTNNIANSNNVYGFKMESASHNTLTGNIANSNVKYGFYCSAGSTGCNGNTFTNNIANSNTEYGIRINSGSSNTLTGNTFNLNGVAGIRLKDDITNLILNENTFTNSPTGIDIATGVGNVISWIVMHNNIAGNIVGVSNNGVGTLNAEDNWWGTNDGSMIATLVLGNVDYTPWAYALGLYDHILPITIISSPDESSWQKIPSFQVGVSDSDTGGAGLANCYYRVYNDLNGDGDMTDAGELIRDWALRICNSQVTLTVGVGMDCRAEGLDRCKIQTKAIDSSGNDNWVSPYITKSRKFSIDFTPPILSITSPSTTDSMSLFSVQASANDGTGSGIQRVNLSLTNNSGSVILSNQNMSLGTTGYEYLLNMWNLTAGIYTITVNAIDNAGNTNIATQTFTITNNVAPSNILPVGSTNVPITGGTVSFKFYVTVRGSNQVRFGMGDIAGLPPSAFNARISNGTSTVPVGGLALTYTGAGLLTLQDNDLITPNIQGNFTLYLDVPPNMIPGNYPISYDIGIV